MIERTRKRLLLGLVAIGCAACTAQESAQDEDTQTGTDDEALVAYWSSVQSVSIAISCTSTAPQPYSVPAGCTPGTAGCNTGSWYWHCPCAPGVTGIECTYDGVSVTNTIQGATTSQFVWTNVANKWTQPYGGNIPAALAGSWGIPVGSTIFTNPGYVQNFSNRWAYVDGYGNATTYTDGRARTRYNQVREVSSHNTYDSSPSIPYTLDQRVRSIEIDIHTDGSGPLVWPVYHETAGNVCSGSGALDDCLKDVAWWHSGHPLHEVITIFIDSPDDVFDISETNSGRGVADFDTLLDQTLGSTNVYRPSAFKTRCPSAPSYAMQTLVATCGWPTLAELRGKFLVVMTGKAAERYPGSTYALSRAAFSAEAITESNWYPVLPSTKSADTIFYNVGTCGWTNPSCDPEDNGDTYDTTSNVYAAGGVSRIYRINNTSEWNQSVDRAAHHIATNQWVGNVDADTPWFSTASVNYYKYPFNCIDPSACNTYTWVENL